MASVAGLKRLFFTTATVGWEEARGASRAI